MIKSTLIAFLSVAVQAAAKSNKLNECIVDGEGVKAASFI